MSIDDFKQMLSEQGHCCPICANPFDESRVPHVDHRHSDGSVRAILCGKCNTAIGMLDDDPVRARTAAAYLEE